MVSSTHRTPAARPPAPSAATSPTTPGGPHTLAYGVTTNHVLGIEVVLDDGQIGWLGGEVPDTPGYDLCGVFVGSEGTMGIVTKVAVRLLQTRESVRTLLAIFDPDGARDRDRSGYHGSRNHSCGTGDDGSSHHRSSRARRTGGFS
mgnify:CR=1 FL=1